MTYAKKTWASGGVIAAADLNNIENGLENVHDEAATLNGIKTFKASPILDFTDPLLEWKYSGTVRRQIFLRSDGKLEIYDPQAAAIKLADIILHAHGGGTGGTQVDHVNLTNVTADQHHSRQHTRNAAADHTGKDDPENVDDYSVSLGEMQTQTDPYPGSSPSQPTDLTGEMARVRYQIAQLLGLTYWYQDAPITLQTLLTHAGRHHSGGADPLALQSIAGVLTNAQHGSLSGGDHTGDLQAVARHRTNIDGVALTARWRYHFLSGKGIKVSGVDDSGNDETEITVSQLFATKHTWYDEFEGSVVPERWTQSVGGTATISMVAGSGNLGGIIKLATGTTTGSIAQLYFNNLRGYEKAFSPAIEGRIKLSQVAGGNFALRFGFATDTGFGTSHRAMIQCDGVNANFSGLTENGGASTLTSLGIAKDTAWHVLRVELSNTQAKFYMDGVLKATVTTTLPADYMQPLILSAISSPDTTNLDVLADYVYVEQNRQT